MKLVKFGNIEVGRVHRIVATVHHKGELAELQGLVEQNLIDILELRADRLFKDGRWKTVENSLTEIKKMKLPIILTIRDVEAVNLREGDRLKLFAKLTPEVDTVDIELRARIRDKVIEIAKSNGKTVIVSEHNMNETPPDTKIESIFRKSLSCGGDIIKIALFANSSQDLARLMRFLAKKSEETPLVCISLGPKGEISRIIAPILGSCLSYAFIEHPVTPGQPSLAYLNAELGKYLDNLHKR